jgi:CheY-like chemotaxis protein
MNKHVLVVDDEQSILDAFTFALQDLPGVSVEAVDNGADAIDRAKARRPELVFLDLKMPGMNGVEVLRVLLAKYPDLPVCIVTAFFEEFMQQLLQASKEGLRFEVVKKPIGKREIIAIAKSYFEGPQLMIPFGGQALREDSYE